MNALGAVGLRCARTLLAGVLLSAAVPVPAALCVPDRVPAATLLFPYFQARQVGVSTIAWISNVGAAPTVAQLTLWTDGGKAVFSAPMYLAGRQRRAFDVTALVFAGNKPDWQAPARPNLSDALTSFPGCDANALGARTLPTVELDRLRRALTGQLNDQNVCGWNFGDGDARGYLTVDVRTACGSETPEQAAYYSGIGHANVLSGEWAKINTSQNFAYSAAAVAIESDTAGGAILATDRSFYGAFSGAGDVDRREPLPTRWMVDRMSSPTGNPGEQRRLTVWRQGPARARVCNGTPPPTIGNSNAPGAIYFDAAGAQTPWTRPGVYPLGSPLTLATAEFMLDAAFGTMPANFRQLELRLQDDPTNSGQSWVEFEENWEGRFLQHKAATPLDGNCRPQTLVLQAPGALVANPSIQVDAFHAVDGFEDGLPHPGL